MNPNLKKLDPSYDTSINDYQKQKYTNPFYTQSYNNNDTTTQLSSSMITDNFCDTTYKEIYKNYNCLYILSLNDNVKSNEIIFDIAAKFYNKDISLKKLARFKNHLVLNKCPISFISQKFIRNGIIKVSSETLNHFNDGEYINDEYSLVVLMLNVKSKTIRKYWINIHKENKFLENFTKAKIFQTYFNINDKILDNYIITMFQNINQSNYWKIEKNCLLSINYRFEQRKFNLVSDKKWDIPFSDINKEIKKIVMNIYQKKNVSINSSYSLNCESGDNDDDVNILKNEKIFISENNKIIKNNLDQNSEITIIPKPSYYEPVNVNNLDFDTQYIREFLLSNSLNDHQRYMVICTLLASKDLCHVVLKDIDVLEKYRDFFEKYKNGIKYAMGYAWVSMFLEESIKKTKTEQDDRFVFTIDQAHLLPNCDFDYENIRDNPYFPHLVSDNITKMSTNILGIDSRLTKNQGIVNLNEFKRRMNIFISGTNKDILTGIDWTNIVMTGGIMAAILPYFNPLMALFIEESKLNTCRTGIDQVSDETLIKFLMNIIIIQILIWHAII